MLFLPTANIGHSELSVFHMFCHYRAHESVGNVFYSPLFYLFVFLALVYYWTVVLEPQLEVDLLQLVVWL